MSSRLADRALPGIRWDFGSNENFYVDSFLCFGLSNAPTIFHHMFIVLRE